MEPPRPPQAFAAPGGSSGGARAPGRDENLPAVDERIVMPESRAEIVGGELVLSPPAEEPHATHHGRLAYVLEAHVADGYAVAVDMLTRTSKENDFAPDASVYPAARDPETGGRQLEELAFEIVSEQAVGIASEKARELVRRGVRRAFCLVVKRRRLLEWSRETDSYRPLREDTEIEDRCFCRPLPVFALLDAARADDAVARALLERGTPALREAMSRVEERGKAEGKAEGKAAAILQVLEARGIAVPEELRSRILAGADPSTLDRWLARAAVAHLAADVLGT
jgi:Uma2 family endonuclease